jgi:integrase
LAKQVLTKALARGYESVFTFNANTLKNKGSHVSRAFKRAAIKIGRGEVTLHELRKLNISMQRERDIPKDVTACQSGHKSQDVLESYYLKYSVEHRLKYYQESFIEGADELLKDRESEGKPKA